MHTKTVRVGLIALLLTCQPAMAGQRVLLIRGLMDYLPGISPMGSLQTRLASEGFDVTMITHLIDGFYGSTETHTGMLSSVIVRERLMPCGTPPN